MQIFVGFRGTGPLVHFQSDVQKKLKEAGIAVKGRTELHATVLIPSSITSADSLELRALLRTEIRNRRILPVYAMVEEITSFETARDVVIRLRLTGEGVPEAFQNVLHTLVNEPVPGEAASPHFMLAKVPLECRDRALEVLQDFHPPVEHVRLDQLVMYDLPPGGPWHPVEVFMLDAQTAVA